MGKRIEQKVEALISPIQTFVSHETVCSAVLLTATVVALVLANSGLAGRYFELVHFPVGLSFGDIQVHSDVRTIVNDGLMTLFFLILGLEIKRELLVGELQDARFAVTVFTAALGGMIAPALIYCMVNWHMPTLGGWGIPMATDTAFALGVLLLLLLGNRVPPGLKVFMVAYAIIDDIGAIIVIAAFYTQALNTVPLGAAAICVLLLLLCNVLGLRHISIYLAFGCLLWLAIVMAGIHGAVAGVLIAATVPARPSRGRRWFVHRAHRLADQLDTLRQAREQDDVLSDIEQHKTVEAVGKVAQSASTPLRRWERSLEAPVLLVILPLFALVNAGIPITVSFLADVAKSPVGWGIVAALFCGKVLGISLLTWVALRSGLGHLPEAVDMRHVVGIGLLGGMGFTMSIFIADLTFATEVELDGAKIAILFASALAGVAGYLWLRFAAQGALSAHLIGNSFYAGRGVD